MMAQGSDHGSIGSQGITEVVSRHDSIKSDDEWLKLIGHFFEVKYVNIKGGFLACVGTPLKP